jgi:VanZ family protein
MPLLGWDKLQHAVAYGLLTCLAGWAFACFRAELKRRWLWAMAAAVLFGAIIELLQGTFTANRAAELGDFLADFTGAGAVAIVAVLVARAGRPKNGR